MDHTDREKLIVTWIERYSDPVLAEQFGPETTSWAFQKLDRLVSDQPELAWTVIMEILVRAQSESVLDNLAAGPLEDLLARHGEDFIARVEATARRSPEFRDLLGGVWENNMSEDLWERIQAACRP